MLQLFVVFFNHLKEARFRIFRPYQGQIQNQNARVEVMAGIAQAERFQFSELEARIACNQAAQYRYVPNGTQRISAEVGIIKFRYIRIDDRIRIQIHYSVVRGQKAGGQQTCICQGREAFDVPVVQHSRQFVRHRAEVQEHMRVCGNGFTQFLYVFSGQAVVDDPDFIAPVRIGMGAQGVKGDGQADGPWCSNGKHDSNGSLSVRGMD